MQCYIQPKTTIYYIKTLLSNNSIDLSGVPDDSNAQPWAGETKRVAADGLDGHWSSRWAGGRLGTDWKNGRASLISNALYIVILYEESENSVVDPYLILAKRIGSDLLRGRYVRLLEPTDSTPWVRIVVNENRIDGYWKKGRWDLRR